MGPRSGIFSERRIHASAGKAESIREFALQGILRQAFGWQRRWLAVSTVKCDNAEVFAIIRPHRIDFGDIRDFPKSSWDKMLREIGVAHAPGRAGSDQRVLFGTDEAFVFVWAATNSQLKEIFERFGVTAYTEEELKASDEAKRRLTLRDSRKNQPVEGDTRHQCHIYNGPPQFGLAKMAASARRMLGEGYRCLYLNSPAIVAEMTNSLAAAGTDVAREIKKTSLVLSSDQSHIVNGSFDLNKMMDALEEEVLRALGEGFKGLWAAGDMAWEFGSDRDFSKVRTYERRLEELFRRQPALNGVCQYHAATIPHEALRDALVSHDTIFVNETLHRANPHYDESESMPAFLAADRLKLDNFIAELCTVGS
jgi:MEDS: MEthanogen/methylotroph, DcmR Sensory domain